MKKSEHKCRRPLCGMPYLANAYCSLRCADLHRLEQRIEHLRAGIEAYREYRRRVQNDQTDDEGWWECIEVLGIWEREDTQRDEKG